MPEAPANLAAYLATAEIRGMHVRIGQALTHGLQSRIEVPLNVLLLTVSVAFPKPPPKLAIPPPFPSEVELPLKVLSYTMSAAFPFLSKNTTFLRNLAPDFLQYTGERPEMSSQ